MTAPIATNVGQLAGAAVSLIPSGGSQGVEVAKSLAGAAVTEGVTAAATGAGIGASLGAALSGGIVAGAVLPIGFALMDILAKRPDFEKRNTAFSAVMGEVALGNITVDQAAAEIVGLADAAKEGVGSVADNAIVALARLVGYDPKLLDRLPRLANVFRALGYEPTGIGPRLDVMENISEALRQNVRGLKPLIGRLGFPFGEAKYYDEKFLSKAKFTGELREGVRYGVLRYPFETLGTNWPENAAEAFIALDRQVPLGANVLGTGHRQLLFADQYLPLLSGPVQRPQEPRLKVSPTADYGQATNVRPAPVAQGAPPAALSSGAPSVAPLAPAQLQAGGVPAVPFKRPQLAEARAWAH